MQTNGVKIIQVEAKDVYITQLASPSGYRVKDKNGALLTEKFRATIPNSIELGALRTAYVRTFRNKRFAVNIGRHAYTTMVVSILFNYAVKQYNRQYGGLFIKLGAQFSREDIGDDIAFIKDGELVAIRCGVATDKCVDDAVLGDCFAYDEENRCYVEAKNKTVVSTGELRRMLYEDGCVIGGQMYVRWMRSSGAARVGKVLFINQALIVRMHKFDLAGINVEQGKPVDLPSLEAYISLAASSIIGTIPLSTKNILLVDDFETSVMRKVMYVENTEDGVAVTAKEAEVGSSAWDGMALLDESAFGEFSKHSFILLRNRFFKSAALKTKLQEFFAENGITDISQLNGKTMATDIKDILLVCTPSSIKYLKFGSFEDFCNNVNKSAFSVVKYDKPSKLFDGRRAECNYQVLNSINFTDEELNALIKPTVDYIHLLKTDPAVMRYHVGANIDKADFSSPVADRAEIIGKLLAANSEFSKTKMYRHFCDEITGALSKAARRGRILVNASFLTMFGNPYELLLHAIGKFDGNAIMGDWDIFTYRHPFDREVVGARSPHICSGSLGVFMNKHIQEIDRWFYINKNIVIVNAIRTPIQNMLNGCDFDSDTMLLIDDDVILQAVKRDAGKYLIPVNGIGSAKTSYTYSMADMAKLDQKTNNRDIAKICNCAQILQSMMFDAVNSGAPQELIDEMYRDLSFLSVLSGLAIDSAKRIADVDIPKCLKQMQKKYSVKDDGKKVMPAFFRPVLAKKHIDASGIKFRYHESTMDKIGHIMNKSRLKTVIERNDSISAIIDKDKVFSDKRSSQRTVYYIRDLIRQYATKTKSVWADMGLSVEEKSDRASELRDELCQYISSLTISNITAYRLVTMLENPKNKDISRTMFTILFGCGVQSFYRIINDAAGGVDYIEEDPDGDIDLYGIKFKKVRK